VLLAAKKSAALQFKDLE